MFWYQPHRNLMFKIEHNKNHSSSYLDVCFSMVSLKGQFKLDPQPHWSPLGGLILIFRGASPSLLYGSPHLGS